MEYERPAHWVAFIGLLLLLTIGSGCRKDPPPASWDVDVLGPVLTTQFTLSDIIPDSIQTVAANGLITIVYNEDLFAVDLDTVLAIPDTNFRYPYAFPLPGNDVFALPAGFPVISQNNLIRFNLPDLALSYLELREGTIDLNMKNKMASRVLGDFSLPSAVFANGPSILQASVEAGTPANPAFSTSTRDLAGVRFDLRGPFFNDVNTLSTNVAAQLDPAGSGALVSNQDSVVIDVSYRNLIPQYARGYFGSRTLSIGPETNGIALFDGFLSGTLSLDQVRLRLKVENGVGVDLRVRLNQFQAANTTTGATANLLHAITQGPINLNRALDLGNGFQPSLYQNELDNSDSNIGALLEILPDEFRYDLDIELNPLGDISNGNDFLYFDSKLKARLELEVPLSIIATDLVLENVVKPDLPGDAENPLIQRGELNVIATNGFPLEARMVLDIVDRDRNLLSQVPVDGVLAAGILGANGLVQTRTTSVLRAPLTDEQVTLLYGNGRFRIRLVFNTIDQTQHVQLLDQYTVDMQFTVGARYLVNGDE